MTNREWEAAVTGSKGDLYAVKFERLPEEAEAEYGYTCTCKSFRFRGHCKHIAAVVARGLRCGWNETLEIGMGPEYADGSDDMTCPRCGGPVLAVKVEV